MHEQTEALIARCEIDEVPGVNICPPSDSRPQAADGYCIRCEGFAQCSARYLRLNRPSAGATMANAG